MFRLHEKIRKEIKKYKILSIITAPVLLCDVVLVLILKHSIKVAEAAAKNPEGIIGSLEAMLYEHAHYARHVVLDWAVFGEFVLGIALVYFVCAVLGSRKRLKDYGGIKKYAKKPSELAMENFESEMQRCFGKSITQIKKFGPAAMGCYSVSYNYTPTNCIITGSGERGIIIVEITKPDGKDFFLSDLDVRAKRYFYDSSWEDVRRLVEITHDLVTENSGESI